MADTKYCCSPITNYFEEYNLIFFGVKERQEGRRRGMIEGRFEKSTREKGKQNIQVIAYE
jgi:predicted transposase YdaD